MSPADRIYLDNAATSWPMPEAVYEAVERAMRHVGAPAGRSAYAEAQLAERSVQAARSNLARLLQVADPRRVIFGHNGTDALNLAIGGLLRPGDHVVTTAAEHNSVLRPLHHWNRVRDVELSIIPCNGQGRVDPEEVGRAIRPRTRLVAVVHASNVTGTLQPIREIAALTRAGDALLLVDAAQTLGHLPFTFAQLGCDILAASGHKGLLGPLGTGVLVLGENMHEQLASIRQGGTGTQSESPDQPDSLPEKYESGNHNVPALAGLAAGVQYLMDRGLEDVRKHDVALCGKLLGGLSDIGGVRVFGPERAEERVGVVSFVIDGYEPQEVAIALDATMRVQARAGLHCAPLMHQALGTQAGGGTVRLSIGPFTTTAHIDRAIEAVGLLASSTVNR